MRIGNAPAQKNARRIRAMATKVETLKTLEEKPEQTEDDKASIAKLRNEIATLKERILTPDAALHIKRKKYRGVR